MKLSILSISTIYLAFLSLESASAANVAINGDFETGDTSGWTSFPSAGSTFVVTVDSHGGLFAGQLTNTTEASAAIMKQANLAAGLISPGDTIEISFFAKGSATNGGVQFAELFSEIAGGGTSKAEILSGAPLFLTNTYQQYTFSATAGPDVSGGISLQLSAFTSAAPGGSTSEMFIDNVVIEVPAIPEPSSTVLLGLGGLALMFRRRR